MAALAGWRVAALFVMDGGPFDVFERLRQRHGVDFASGTSKPGFIPGLLACVWCTSPWTTGAAFAIAHWVSIVPVALVAAMGAAIMVHEFIMREGRH